MFKKSIILACVVSLSLSVSAVASAIKDKAFEASHVEAAKITQLKASPELNEQPVGLLLSSKIDRVTTAIVIFDYGAVINGQSSANKSESVEHTAFSANFAKVQNQNFERMLSISNT